MREQDFLLFLNNEPTVSSTKAVATRLRHAKRAQTLLGRDLDDVVSDDDVMYQSLKDLRKSDSQAHAPMQNAVRKYYKFRNGKEFPRMKEYHSPKHP